MALPEDFWTFKDIDTHHACAKGSAFRAFKGMLGILREGEDFHHLDAQHHGETIQRLKGAGRLYPSTINAVLLTPAGYQRLRKRLPVSPPTP